MQRELEHSHSGLRRCCARVRCRDVHVHRDVSWTRTDSGYLRTWLYGQLVRKLWNVGLLSLTNRHEISTVSAISFTFASTWKRRGRKLPLAAEHLACPVPVFGLSGLRNPYQSPLLCEILTIIKPGTSLQKCYGPCSKTQMEGEFSATEVIGGVLQGSFPRGTTGNGVPTLIFAVGTRSHICFNFEFWTKH